MPVDDAVAAARKKQKAVIESVENSAEGSKGLTTLQKGNYGEMKMDDYFESQGYKRLGAEENRVTDLNEPTHQGIDGVYYNPNGHPPYIIGEAKYGSSKLSKTRDGKQMSEPWIKGSNRLVNAVGKETADDILLEGYGKKLVNIAPDGTISIVELSE